MANRGRLGYRKSWRIESARIREEARNQRTPEEQNEELNKRLGVGIGASKERDRLYEQWTNK